MTPKNINNVDKYLLNKVTPTWGSHEHVDGKSSDKKVDSRSYLLGYNNCGDLVAAFQYLLRGGSGCGRELLQRLLFKVPGFLGRTEEGIAWCGSGDIGDHGNRRTSSRPARPIQGCGSSLLRKSPAI
ncbi:hypothetical protein AVEN_6766-1 [Araneus ventricosus]|uniref:Uncharacterized protein n=1 Tax=Araneus ventricosus TaxID=182803 RepID=A0A4Y2GTM6_ARAVE|nr:hypothetical protein AVEN_6766-1 [Araneus ventricosus]